jgi:hypothetical protein
MSKTIVLLPWQQLSEQGSQPAICWDCPWHNIRLSDSECKPFTTGNYHCHSVLRGLFGHFDCIVNSIEFPGSFPSCLPKYFVLQDPMRTNFFANLSLYCNFELRSHYNANKNFAFLFLYCNFELRSHYNANKFFQICSCIVNSKSCQQDRYP